MSTVRIRLRSGDEEIEIEGSKSEVDEYLRAWWSQSGDQEGTACPKKAGKKAAPPRRRAIQSRNAQAGEPPFEALELANSLKEDANFSKYATKVLHARDLFNKVALVAMHSETPLTSGQITAVLQALDVKADVGNVSNCIKNNGSKFLPSAVRRAGGAKPQYKLTSQARAAYEQWLNSV
jgi:hypothetical protein